MKKTSFVAVFAAIALMGYAQKNNYTIKGKVDDSDIKVVYLDQEGKGYDGILDSAIVINGEFTFAGNFTNCHLISPSQYLRLL